MLELLIFILMVSFLFVAFIDRDRDQGPSETAGRDSVLGYVLVESSDRSVLDTLYPRPLTRPASLDSVYLHRPGVSKPECLTRRVTSRGGGDYPAVIRIRVGDNHFRVSPGDGWDARAAELDPLQSLVRADSVSVGRFMDLGERTWKIVDSPDSTINPFGFPCELFATVRFSLSTYSAKKRDQLNTWLAQIEHRFLPANREHFVAVDTNPCLAFNDKHGC